MSSLCGADPLRTSGCRVFKCLLDKALLVHLKYKTTKKKHTPNYFKVTEMDHCTRLLCSARYKMNSRSKQGGSFFDEEFVIGSCSRSFSSLSLLTVLLGGAGGQPVVPCFPLPLSLGFSLPLLMSEGITESCTTDWGNTEWMAQTAQKGWVPTLGNSLVHWGLAWL